MASVVCSKCNHRFDPAAVRPENAGGAFGGAGLGYYIGLGMGIATGGAAIAAAPVFGALGGIVGGLLGDKFVRCPACGSRFVK